MHTATCSFNIHFYWCTPPPALSTYISIGAHSFNIHFYWCTLFQHTFLLVHIATCCFNLHFCWCTLQPALLPYISVGAHRFQHTFLLVHTATCSFNIHFYWCNLLRHVSMTIVRSVSNHLREKKLCGTKSQSQCL